jgi:hypothetical protein
MNVVESWTSANEFIFYGRSGGMASHCLDNQELTMLALPLLQACLGDVNTLRLPQVLADPTWLTPMTSKDCRELTPLIYHHVNPYGSFELDLDKRLAIGHSTDVRAAGHDRERLFSAKSAPRHAVTMCALRGGDVMRHPSFSAKVPPHETEAYGSACPGILDASRGAAPDRHFPHSRPAWRL